MDKLNWKKFIDFWSQFYGDNKNLDEMLYEPYIKNLKDGFLKNLWPWKMGYHYKHNQKALRLMKEKKEFIINFRKSDPSFEDLYNFSKKIFKNGIVYSVFLMHICKPEEYPIFDQHVFRSFVFITKKEIVKEPKDIKDYLKYKDFVLSIHKNTGISLRDIDKGLMAFGQFLVNPLKILKR